MWDLIVSVPDHCLSFYKEKDKAIKDYKFRRGVHKYIHSLCPKQKPTGYSADPDKGIGYHWIPDQYKKYQNWLKSKQCGYTT